MEARMEGHDIIEEASKVVTGSGQPRGMELSVHGFRWLCWPLRLSTLFWYFMIIDTISIQAISGTLDQDDKST